jgi:acetyl esterase/lipase
MLISMFMLLSLLTVFRAPTNIFWYISILITEFSWIFFFIVLILLLSGIGGSRYGALSWLLGIVAMALYSVPVIGAYTIAQKLKVEMGGTGTSNTRPGESSPFSFSRMVTGINAQQVVYKTLTYDAPKALTLDFYPASAVGKKPCVLVVHGGSWAGGDSRQLPELNSELAKAGYNVATINYRLAPRYKYPAPVEDVQTALNYLRSHSAALSLDPDSFVLLGRSAGGQIVLSAAYTLNDPAIKGVISFYGPANMIWGYANPTNPLVLNSRKVMEDYLGGTYQQVPQQYASSSATETATKNSVATLLIHGENDPLVSHIHGLKLDAKLDGLGVKHYDLYLPWATHGFDWTLNGPAGQLSTWRVKRFLEKVVGN